jgi:hypothetical protein
VNVIQFRNLIREEIARVLNEDEFEDVFGQIPFGDSYKILKYLNLSKDKLEFNTSLESKIYDAFIKWLDAPTNSSAKTINGFKDVINIGKKKYPTIFSPTKPNDTLLYRGLRWQDAVTNKIAAFIAKQDTVESYAYVKDIDHVLCKTPYKNYRPILDIQSWSYSVKSAMIFTYGSSEKAQKQFGTPHIDQSAVEHGPILVSKQNDEYAFNPRVIHELEPILDQEQEEIHLGKTYSNNIYLLIHVEQIRGLLKIDAKSTDSAFANSTINLSDLSKYIK